MNQLLGLKELETELTVAYARVTSRDQKEDLKRQVERLELYCTAKGWKYEVIQDLGSGINYRKKGLKQLLEKILNCQVKRVVLTHKDRLLRIGGELVFALCEARNVEVVIINQGETPYDEHAHLRFSEAIGEVMPPAVAQLKGLMDKVS